MRPTLVPLCAKVSPCAFLSLAFTDAPSPPPLKHESDALLRCGTRTPPGNGSRLEFILFVQLRPAREKTQQVLRPAASLKAAFCTKGRGPHRIALRAARKRLHGQHPLSKKKRALRGEEDRERCEECITTVEATAGNVQQWNKLLFCSSMGHPSTCVTERTPLALSFPTPLPCPSPFPCARLACLGDEE